MPKVWVLLILASCWVAPVQHTLAKPQKTTATQKLIKTFEKRYSVQVKTQVTQPRYITFSTLSTSDHKRETYRQTVQTVLGELKRYPACLVHQSKLKTIAFVQHLKVNGQKRAASFGTRNHTLYYDINYLKFGNYLKEDVVHHEFYHLYETAVHGTPYYRDPHWQKLNPKGFHYGRGGMYAQKSGSNSLSHPSPGFVSNYALAAEEEDRAEIYSSLWVHTKKRKVNQWIKQDVPLKKKVVYLKKSLAKSCKALKSLL